MESAIDGDSKKALAAGKIRIGLKNVVWARPIRVEDEPAAVQIILYGEENGVIGYEIYGEVNGEEFVYGQGSAVLSEITDTSVLA